MDLTAAYDTVNHRGLLLKLSKTLKNKTIVDIIRSLIENRKFFVEMDGTKSRWRSQKNGLPQGSVLAPLLFNIYTNDQPSPPNVRRFIYADDLCLATRATTFQEVETRLSSALEQMGQYYDKWSLNPNPLKTQVCAFHLRNKEANRKLKILWRGEELEHHQFPVYLGVTLDRTLSFATHLQKLRGKVGSRNSLLKKTSRKQMGSQCSNTQNNCPSPVLCTSRVLCTSVEQNIARKENRSYAQRSLQSHHWDTTTHSHQHPLQTCWYCSPRNQEVYNI